MSPEAAAAAGTAIRVAVRAVPGVGGLAAVAYGAALAWGAGAGWLAGGALVLADVVWSRVAAGRGRGERE